MSSYLKFETKVRQIGTLTSISLVIGYLAYYRSKRPVCLYAEYYTRLFKIKIASVLVLN